MAQTSSGTFYLFDLFAGCGGLSTGMELANFETLLVSELNQYAMESFLTNRVHSLGGILFRDFKELHLRDINELTEDEMRKIFSELENLGLLRWDPNGCGSSLDLICGGPPCQGYSTIGHRRSYGVDKIDIISNSLFQKMTETIEFFRPKLFLFENVSGLLRASWYRNGRRGDIWEVIWSSFSSIAGYEARWSLLKAKDYGVPQNRPRVILVGVRKDILERSSVLQPENHPEDAVTCGFLPAPSGSVPDPIELLSDLVDPKIVDYLQSQKFPKILNSISYLRDPESEIQTRLRTRRDKTLMGKGTPLTDQEYSKHSPQILERFQYMLKHNGELPYHLKTKKFSQRVIPEKWGNDGPNITATSLPDDYVHFCQPRSLTVRELARLQMFPDWYEFRGPRTTGGLKRAGNPTVGNFDREVPKYTQIGNAVPVELARRIGEHFKKILTD